VKLSEIDIPVKRERLTVSLATYLQVKLSEIDIPVKRERLMPLFTRLRASKATFDAKATLQAQPTSKNGSVAIRVQKHCEHVLFKLCKVLE
jgi:hypothetical protein